MRTLFIAGLNSQYHIWNNDILPVCNTVDAIIQCGNLIGLSGSVVDSDSHLSTQYMLESVMGYRKRNPSYVQLMGPHEMVALNFPEKYLSPKSARILRGMWFDSDDALVAYAHNGRLVTFGGLTHGQWCVLGKPGTAEEAAELINDKYMGTLYQGHGVRLGDYPNFEANPVWADPMLEFYPSWIAANDVCPFDQVHASGDLNSREARYAYKNPSSLLHYVGKVSYTMYGSRTDIKNATMTGINLHLDQTYLSPSLQSAYTNRAPYIENYEE